MVHKTFDFNIKKGIKEIHFYAYNKYVILCTTLMLDFSRWVPDDLYCCLT